MQVKHITKDTFDIFFDNGWENWARFLVKENKLHQIAGVSVPKPIQIFLNKRYLK